MMKCGKFVAVDPRARSYSKHIQDAEWDRVRSVIEELHRKGVYRSTIRAELRDKHDFTPSPAQLQSRMQKWGLLVYKNTLANPDTAKHTNTDERDHDTDRLESPGAREVGTGTDPLLGFEVASQSLQPSTRILYEPKLPDTLDDLEQSFEDCLQRLSRSYQYPLTDDEQRNKWLAYSLFQHGHRLHSHGVYEATSTLSNAASLAFGYMKKPSVSLVGDLLRIYFIWWDSPQSCLRDPTYQFLISASAQIPEQRTRASVKSLLNNLTSWNTVVLPKDAILERFLIRQSHYPVDRIDTFYDPRELFVRVLMEDNQNLRAEKECQNLLDWMIMLKGPDHADTRRILRLLGRIFQRQERLSEAQNIFAQLWIAWQRDYESNVRSKHVRDWCTVRDLAVVSEIRGDKDSATHFLWQTYVLSLMRYGGATASLLWRKDALVKALVRSEYSNLLSEVTYHEKYDASYFTFAQRVTQMIQSSNFVCPEVDKFDWSKAADFDTLTQISTGDDALVVW